MHFKSCIVVIASLFSNCSSKNDITNIEIDNFISKYDSVKFDQLNDVSITQRCGNFSDIVYIVGKGEGNIPVYLVTFDFKKNEIAEINRENLIKRKVRNYLSSDEILNAVLTIRKYDFYFLAVDSLKNVYINPFYVNDPPYFLRLNAFTGDSIVKKGYVYDIR
jgi:hypothetical protein